MEEYLKKHLLNLSWEDFLENQRFQLLHRKSNKLQILKDGGEAALIHSQDDIRLIDMALLKVKCGHYGQCENCGTAITRERLLIIPEARFCRLCAEEIGH